MWAEVGGRLYCVLLLWLAGAAAATSLCSAPGCGCTLGGAGLVAVQCRCGEADQVLRVGLQDRVAGAAQPPNNTISLTIENCHHVELYSRIVNHMTGLANLTVRDTHSLVVHPRLYEARVPGSGNLSNIQFTNIGKLQVRRYGFKDLRVSGMLYLGEVSMQSVVSLAFHLEYVGEFSVFASKFERISMFGVKIERCKEFNVLGMTHFSSLAAHAIKLRCDKFSLAYNWFGQLHDSSLDVEFGLCDIQGNTFHSLQGKPFLSLSPQFSLQTKGTAENEIAMAGLVFRENQFSSQPDLPFASLVLPAFSLLPPASSYVDIDQNQFVCSCQAAGWLLSFGKLGHQEELLARAGTVENAASLEFVRLLYGSAGRCLECGGGGECRETADTPTGFSGRAVRLEAAGRVTCDGLLVAERATSSEDSERGSTPARPARPATLGQDEGERVTQNLVRSTSSALQFSAHWPCLLLFFFLTLFR